MVTGKAGFLQVCLFAASFVIAIPRNRENLVPKPACIGKSSREPPGTKAGDVPDRVRTTVIHPRKGTVMKVKRILIAILGVILAVCLTSLAEARPRAGMGRDRDRIGGRRVGPGQGRARANQAWRRGRGAGCLLGRDGGGPGRVRFAPGRRQMGGRDRFARPGRMGRGGPARMNRPQRMGRFGPGIGNRPQRMGRGRPAGMNRPQRMGRGGPGRMNRPQRMGRGGLGAGNRPRRMGRGGPTGPNNTVE